MNIEFFELSYIVFDMKHLNRLKLRQFEVLIEVARRKSVSRAAEALSMTQPAVSRTIRELEAACGVPLVQKDGRGIRMTPEGTLFSRHAGKSLAAIRSGMSAILELSSPIEHTIRIGALPTVSASIMPAAVDRCLESDLKMRLRIISGENHVLLQQLRYGDLDLVVGRLAAPEKMDGLHFEPLYRDRVVLVVDSEHPLAQLKIFPASAINDYPVLVPPHGSIIRPAVDRLFLEHGLPTPSNAIETVSDSFGRAFVRRRTAIWIISHGVVAAQVASGEFIMLPIDTTTTIGSVGLTTRSEQELSVGARVFTSILKEIVAADGRSYRQPGLQRY